jgi:tetratricopeptide (TPR) repeat protein
LAHKRHDRHAAPVTAASLRARVERAHAEGRFQQGLELAKQLYRSEATPQHRDLLKKSYLGRARQLRTQGYTRDAVTCLEAALRLDESEPAWLEQAALEFAWSGEVRQALALRGRLPPDAAGAARVLAAAADAAVEKEAAGRDLLPEELRPDFDRVLTAFAQQERGADDAAREALQGIGLRSPFLEWKLLLRGLQAYYQNDDARALDNWQRLASERLPARLAAPYRMHLDPAYRSAQPPSVQSALQSQLSHLQGFALGPQLRALRAALADPESLSEAFRLAQGLLPALRREAPHLEPRLARCCYAAVLNTGPDDLGRYQRVFGAPPDDPHLHRLRALAHDRGGDLKKAHENWLLYEKDVADRPEMLAPGQAQRARALIWLRMGENAASLPTPAARKKLPPHLRGPMAPPPPLRPTAEQCLERSLELAPDLLEAHQALFRWHRDEGRPARAEKAARKLLERFPDHVETLSELARLLREKEQFAESLELFQRALHGNPLDRDLRGEVCRAHLYAARPLALEGRFDEARRHYQAALALGDADDADVLARWAGCEFKAGQTERAEELLTRARTNSRSPLNLSYQMVIESARLKLDRRVKARFDREFKEGLAAKATGVDAAALLGTTAALEKARVEYVGRKTHRQKVLTYLNKVRVADWEERPLMQACDSLLGLKALPQARTFAGRGQRRFGNNPYFPFFEASSWFLDRPDRMPFFQVRMLLEEADRLLRDWPADDRRDRLARDVKERLEALSLLDPFGSAMGMFGRGFDPFGDEYDESDED